MMRSLMLINKKNTNQYSFCIATKRASSLASTGVRSKPCLSWAGSTKLASKTPVAKEGTEVCSSWVTLYNCYTFKAENSSKCKYNLLINIQIPIAPRPSLPAAFQTLQNGWKAWIYRSMTIFKRKYIFNVNVCHAILSFAFLTSLVKNKILTLMSLFLW